MKDNTIPFPIPTGRLLAQSLPPILILLALSLLLVVSPAGAQEGGAVQEIFGQIGVDGGDIYRLSDLERDQVLSVYAESIGGNLDPFLLLSDANEDPTALREAYRTQLAQAIASGEDPVLAIPQIIGDLAMAWDDDSGGGYDAAIVVDIPADGDYLLWIAPAPTSDTFGQYRLLIGLDAPQVLAGDAEQTGDIIAVQETSALITSSAVQQITGTLAAGQTSSFHELNQLGAGETLYAYVEATAGDLKPVLILEDFAGKAVRTGNFGGQESSASLEFTAPEILENYELRIEAFDEGSSRTSGDYRLIVGRNAPEVLEGVADVRGDPILQAAVPVQVGLKLQQITDVDQQAENFGAVATMQMRWQDPRLAFNPDDCQCDLQNFSSAEFANYAREKGSLWPEFTLFNQQGRRFTQNDNVIVWPNGDVLYFERFSATLQAPDFDFRRFPFDTQRFYLRLDSLFPESFFLFEELPEYSEVGEQLGEEEWIVLDFDTEIESSTASSTLPVSRYSFGFTANRHLSFYIIRIFVPIVIIIMVSWFTFFLKDYSKRVDVTAGNLLLFIAFNFTISGELPRLGYLTFLDVILISTFAVTALVVAFNVVLRRLELSGRGELAQQIDRYTLWIYPAAYVGAIAIVAILFT